MITFISFILVMAGCVNWLIIGLMQYDFVAGIFGTQSSLLSRLVYIAIGFGAVWLILMSFVQKGRIKINDNGFKRLNKALPAPQNNNMQNNGEMSQKNDEQHTHQQRNKDFLENSSKASQQSQQTFDHTITTPHSESPLQENFIEAGNEFHSTNSQRKNPFD